MEDGRSVLLFLALLSPPVFQISVKTVRNEGQGLLLHVYGAHSVVAPAEHPRQQNMLVMTIVL